MDVLQGVSLSLFWVGMTLGPERTMQTIFCGIFFFCRKLSIEYFTFLQKVAATIYKKSDTFQFCMQLRLVCAWGQTSKKPHFQARWWELSVPSTDKEYRRLRVSLLYFRINSDSSLLKHECAQRGRQLTHFCEVHAKSYLFTVAVIFRIGTVQIELLANCKGEIDFQRWLLCPVCIR